jgi:hypothetical protein
MKTIAVLPETNDSRMMSHSMAVESCHLPSLGTIKYY